jgi:cell wall-associated NlpC family hydrolase
VSEIVLSGLALAQIRGCADFEARRGREACGFVVDDGGRGVVAIEARNVAPDPTQDAVPDGKTHAHALRRGIVALWHSHPDGPYEASPADQAAADAAQLPMLLYHVPTGRMMVLKPRPYYRSLVGRPWAWVKADCRALVVDYYRDLLGVELPVWPRSATAEESDSEEIPDGFAEFAGFRELESWEPLRRHDVLTFAVRSRRENHLGVYVGDSTVLHHPQGGLSQESNLDGWAQRCLRRRLRHGAAR